MPVTVRQAGREDLPAIIAIEEASFSVPWSHQSLAAELDNPVAKYYVLEGETGQVLGYADVWLIADEGQLANIAIHPSARGHGYGETLLRTAMAVRVCFWKSASPMHRPRACTASWATKALPSVRITIPSL